ncbi:MAG: hypothetical protein EP340_00080 [Alphaproteobacteria bacterium]|nr:MAG: hypothetical protein EP340_00080 [Alphaproteobacteria bacterium]
MQDATNNLLTLVEIKQSIAAVFLVFLGAVVTRLVQPKSKVVWSPTHGFVFSVPAVNEASEVSSADAATEEPEQMSLPSVPSRTVNYYTNTIFVQNVGRGPAEQVELIFNFRPAHLQVWPLIPFVMNPVQDGRWSLEIENLAPKEFFSIELLGLIEPPDLLYVRSKTGTGKKIEMIPQVNLKLRTKLLIWGIFFAGVYFVCLSLVRVAVWLWAVIALA